MKKIAVSVLISIATALIIGCEETKVVDVVGDIPAVPTGVTSITRDEQVAVSWRANNDNGLTEGYGVYQLTRVVDGIGEYELLERVGAGQYLQNDGSDIRYYQYLDDHLSNGTTYYYAVNAYNSYGESELSQVDAMDTPRPEGTATLRDFHRYPNSAGFDFSRFQTVRFDNSDADIYFEYDTTLNAFFFFAANSDVDIQSYGYTGSLTDVGWGNPGDTTSWSQVGWMELVLHHSYIVWTADNHYATFRVDSFDYHNHFISISWAYQTETGNPELKRRPIARPPHAANYGRREG